MADDWGELMPGRRERFERIYRRIAEEADEVIVVNPALAERFAGRRPHVVRNGVFDDMLIESQRAPEERTMVYVGTLTPRFDAPLMREVLTALPDWRLELVGACMYPGYSDGPAPELEQLLGLHQRVRWHGPMSRERSTEVLDRAAVAVVPNRRERSLGQDSMKFYDYAARGRPIVTTDWRDGIEQEGPPHVLVARTPDEFVRGVLAAARQRPEAASDGRRWAAQNTWNQRWVAWSRAVFGS
jgi:glycosyltransferase involved in cell wall biosynthesis